jgi:hypothetical protein
MSASGMVSWLLVAVLLSRPVAAAEDGSWSDGATVVGDGSTDGGGELVTEDISNGTDFFPELIDSENLTNIGRIVIFAALGAMASTGLYVCTYAWKHDRFCFSYPHPDDEHDGMCAVPRDSMSCAAAEGTDAMQQQPDGASI